MNMDPFSLIVAILVYVAVIVFIAGMTFRIVVWVKGTQDANTTWNVPPNQKQVYKIF